ncbi:MAG: hypothetical protein HC827_09785 [Cyanobacteria bacterium RM1_2_2]|nr:hypothetical protein [Cyanobacteria bacterium RM1_2_2]
MVTIVREAQWVGIDVSQAWLDVALRPAGTDLRVSNQHRMGRTPGSTATP